MRSKFKSFIKGIILVSLSLTLYLGRSFAYEELVTVPAEDPHGVSIKLEKGKYIAKIAGGAITLFYPINPNYCWLIGVAVGTDVLGGQDEPNIGTIYFEPNPPVYTQSEAERQALIAAQENLSSTFIEFRLEEDKEVRFWVSDFDYTDNSGMVKMKINSIEE